MAEAVRGLTVLIAGATSASGRAVAQKLVAAGAHVIAVGTRRDALDELAASVPSVEVRVCDLTDALAVAALAKEIRSTTGPVDGVIHLVGGWRGGGGLTDQSDADWEALDRSFATLRVTSREFYNDLIGSSAGRLAIVSSTSVEHPAAGGANYAAAKSAAETWTRAVAQGFRKAGSPAAAAIFVVTSLSGLESALADGVVALWGADATALNGARIPVAR